jgi:ribonuclease E
VRSVSSVALQLLRAVEEALIKSATHSLIVRTRSDVALYVLNHKRAHLQALEQRFKLTITVNADATVTGPISYVIERGEQVHTPEVAKALIAQSATSLAPELDAEDADADAEAIEEIEGAEDAGGESEAVDGEAAEGEENGKRRKRRRRRRRTGQPSAAEPAMAAGDTGGAADDEEEPEGEAAETAEAAANGAGGDADARRRRRGRRGRRGGRRERGEEDGATERAAAPAEFGTDGETADPLAGVSAPQAEPEPFETQPTYGKAAEPSHDDTSHAPHQHPAPEPAASPAPAAEEQPARPRRRSTVREPAPVFSEQAAAPASFEAAPEPAPAPESVRTPQPVATPEPAVASEPSSPEADDNQPRRTGWWSRRMMGES